jgi:O-antigen ligase
MHLLEARQEIELGDAADQRLHIAIAALALAVAPLGVVGGEVALVVLLGVSLVRARTLWPAWGEALRSPVTVWLAALVGWAGLSLLWSAEPSNGADRFQCLRALVWAPLIYPLVRERAARVVLLVALLSGITVLAVSQIWEWAHFGLFIAPRGELFARIFAEKRFGGLHGEVGKAGIWSAAGVCIGAFLSAGPGVHRYIRLFAAAATVICLCGLWACASLRAIIPTAVAMPLIALIAGSARRAEHASLRRWILAVPVALALIGLALSVDRRMAIMSLEPAPASGAYDADNVPSAAHIADPASEEQTPLDWILRRPSIAPRLTWWHSCWNGFRDHPLIGGGWGATPALVQSYRDAEAGSGTDSVHATNQRQAPVVSQPHSLYLMVLGELGGIGFALLAGVVWRIGRYSLASARACIELGGPAAATLVWLMAAAGDTVFNSAVMACGAILMSFIAPLPRGRFSGGSAVPV